ncbi:DNA polymerase III subunit beta, partial [Clostridium paraputrificum]
MIIICNKQKLQDGISICQKAITGKSTMPILEGIYINATKEGITLIGSDIDVCIETKVDADVLEEGKVVIDSKIFGEIIRKLPNSDVRIEIIQDDTVQITCEKSVFNVVFMNADEFPSIPKLDIAKELKVSQSILKNMIKSTSFAIAQDETRPILQGILFEVKEKKLNLVALDGYRMAIKTEYLDNDFDIEVVIPG